MGHTTDFVGHLDIEPVLHRDEIEYLTVYGRSLGVDSSKGVYVAHSEPESACPWVPRRDGTALTPDGHADCGDPVAWLRYLVGFILRPRVKPPVREMPQLEHFTFDHTLHGMVVGRRRESGELFAITARGRRISSRVLWTVEPSTRGDDPTRAVSRRDGPRTPRGYGNVIDLAARRARG